MAQFFKRDLPLIVYFLMFVLFFSLNRHHMDAGNCDSRFQQRGPPLIPDHPELDPGPLVGAILLRRFLKSLVLQASSPHHTPASSPAGPCPPGVQSQGQMNVFCTFKFKNGMDVVLTFTSLFLFCFDDPVLV